MTEIRLFLPEYKGGPMVIFHEDLLEKDVKVNLKFDNFELDYGSEMRKCVCCEEEGPDIPRLVVKDGIKTVFDMDFNKHFLLNLEIKHLKQKQYEISFWIVNMDDGDTCEVCINNRFYFKHKSIVNNYSFTYYSPPKGPFQYHEPDPKEELSNDILEELK